MSYDFDTVINRKNTKSYKFDQNAAYGMPEDVLPLWVADMDFKCAPEIVEALEEAARFGVYGYSIADDDYFAAVAGWYERHFDFKVKKEWLVYTPGVVFAFNNAIRAFTNNGDAVLIQKPVYYPFTNAILNNGRRLINSPLVYKDGRYQMDLADFEDKIVKENVKLFMLCSPHNPVGRVWTAEELRAVGEICNRHGVTVVADEIHHDIVFKGKHTIYGQLGEEFLNNCVICTAPSKTFNLAGLQLSNIFVPNADLRERLQAEIRGAGYDLPNMPSLFGVQAAYAKGDEWVKEMLAYVYDNYLYLKAEITAKLPKIRVADLEGTYLVWLDLSAYGLTDGQINDIIVNKAKLWFDAGTIFGKEGDCCTRINLASPRSVIRECIDRLYNAFKEV